EWTMHRSSVFAGLNLGKAKAGANGVEPTLEIQGQFDPGTSFTVTLQASAPAPTQLVIVYGNDKANIPLAGGTLVPLIAGVSTLPSDANGMVSFTGALPADVPLGAVTYLQFVHASPGASFGVAFSNA